MGSSCLKKKRKVTVYIYRRPGSCLKKRALTSARWQNGTWQYLSIRPTFYTCTQKRLCKKLVRKSDETTEPVWGWGSIQQDRKSNSVSLVLLFLQSQAVQCSSDPNVESNPGRASIEQDTTTPNYTGTHGCSSRVHCIGRDLGLALPGILWIRAYPITTLVPKT